MATLKKLGDDGMVACETGVEVMLLVDDGGLRDLVPLWDQAEQALVGLAELKIIRPTIALGRVRAVHCDCESVRLCVVFSK